jgi:hypothetical protein
MEERRKAQRHKTLKAGTINFNRAGGVDCRVRNLSPAGACLEVASQIGIPNEFVLVAETDHMKAPCQVIWRPPRASASPSMAEAARVYAKRAPPARV